MDIKVSGDIKTVKMFRRLEEFLDREELAGRDMIDFQNAETGRVFAVVLTPAAFEKVSDYIDVLDTELDEAMYTIETLGDDNQLLAIIDAQNEVLMGRVAVDEVGRCADASSAEKTECPCKTTEASSESPLEDKDNVIISAQEYEELLNLRRKREDNHKQLSSMDAKLKEYRKAINTLQASRDQWHTRADENYEMALSILNNTRRQNGLRPLDLVPAPWSNGRTAFTADAIREGDVEFFGYKPEDFR